MEHDASTRLALDRTYLAHERTLMAWIRTATSLIGFGFAIYKFFEYLSTLSKPPTGRYELGPHGFALLMIGIGIGSLIIATVQQRNAMKSLEMEYGVQRRSAAIKLAAAVTATALGLFVLVLLRL